MSFSIKAFFGGDTTALRGELGSLEGTVKDSFGKMDQHSKGGLADNVKGIHHAVRQLHQFLVAGGIVEVVKHFFESTIEGANKSKDATDESVQAVRRFGKQWESLKEGVTDVKIAVLGFFNQAGEGWGMMINRLRGYSAEQRAAMDKTRIDLEAQTEAFAKRNEIAKIHRDTLFAEADLLGKAKILLQDNHALELQMSKLKVDSVEYAKAEAQIKKNTFDAGKLITEQEEKTAAMRRKTAEDQKKDQAELQKGYDADLRYLNESVDLDEKLAKIAFDKLTPEKQITTLLKERVALLAEINNADTDENEVKRDKIKLNAIDNQLEKLKADLVGDVLEAEKKVTAEKEKQVAAAEHVAEVNKKASLDVLDETLGNVRGPNDFQNASDQILQEIIKRDKRKASDIRSGFGLEDLATQVSGNFASKTVAAQYDLDAGAAQRELDSRKNLRGADYTTALRNYKGDPLNFDQFYQSVNSTNQIATQSHQALLSISNSLRDILR